MRKQKSSIKRDEYKKFLTFMQEKMGIKVLATRTCHSIEDCDVAFFKILRAYESDELEELRRFNKDLQTDNINLELKVDELINKLADLDNENYMLMEKIQERKEPLIKRILKYIFG